MHGAFQCTVGRWQARQILVLLTSTLGASRTNPLLLLLVNLLEIRSRLQPLPSIGKTLLFVLPTPNNSSVLQSWLSSYPNFQDALILRNGFSQGFSLKYNGPRRPKDAGCLASASDNPLVVLEKFGKEITWGQIAGPFKKKTLRKPAVFPNWACS